MKRHELTKEQAMKLAKQSGRKIIEPVMILAIWGYYKDSMGKPGENDRGLYDDAMFFTGPSLFIAVNANTDPSKYKSHIANLIPGLHYYKKGMYILQGRMHIRHSVPIRLTNHHR